MESMFLTRRQYNYLVENCFAWMGAHWAEYSKNWTIGGVTVRATAGRIENLRCQLPELPAEPVKSFRLF